MGIDDAEDDVVNPKHALLGEPIVGTKVVTYDSSGPGSLKPKLLPAPKGMTEAQWAEHCVSHVKYSDACPFCVACRRPNIQHRKTSESTRRLLLLVADYCFPKNLSDSKPLTILVMRMYPYKTVFATVCPAKGEHPEIVQRIARFIREHGLMHIAFRSDREPAIAKMIEAACIQASRKPVPVTTDDIYHTDIGPEDGTEPSDLPSVERAVHEPAKEDPLVVAAPEFSHPGESKTNGLAEVSARDFEDHFRTLKAAFESRMGRSIDSDHPIIEWMVEHSAYLLSKLRLGTDGHTAYGRLHGKESVDNICEFGEKILWYVPRRSRGKLEVQ